MSLEIFALIQSCHQKIITFKFWIKLTCATIQILAMGKALTFITLKKKDFWSANESYITSDSLLKRDDSKDIISPMVNENSRGNLAEPNSNIFVTSKKQLMNGDNRTVKNDKYGDGHDDVTMKSVLIHRQQTRVRRISNPSTVNPLNHHQPLWTHLRQIMRARPWLPMV